MEHLADYESSDEDVKSEPQEAKSLNYFKNKNELSQPENPSPTSVYPSSSSFSSQPPQLPTSFYDIPIVNGKSLDITHENIHCYIYIDWIPDLNLWTEFKHWTDQLLHLNSWNDVTSHVLSTLDIPQPLHLSLTENITVSCTQIDQFVGDIKSAIDHMGKGAAGKGAAWSDSTILINMAQPLVLANKLSTRFFAGFAIQQPNSYITGLIEQFNVICEKYAQKDHLPCHTLDPCSAHVTLASFSAQHTNRDVQFPKSPQIVPAIPTGCIKMRLGPRVHMFALT